MAARGSCSYLLDINLKKKKKIKACSSPDIDIMYLVYLLVVVYGWWTGGDGVCGELGRGPAHALTPASHLQPLIVVYIIL